MSAELPYGWATIALGDLFAFKYGKALPQEKRNSKGAVNVYGSNGVVGSHDHAVTRGPTIIVGRKGSVGEVHLSPHACWPIDTTYYVDEFPGDVPPNYWALFLKSLRLGQQEKSSAIPGISRDDVYAVEVPFAPLNEQKRIIVKLEKLLAKVDTCQQRLAKIPVLLKRFRQSVLAAACSGRLTADWREEHGHDDEWPTRRLFELGSVTGGVTKNAKNKGMGTQVPYLRVANVYENRLELSEVLEIGVTEQELKRTRLVKDDLLFVEGNGSVDQIGRVALWDGSIPLCVHQNHLIKFRAGKDVVPAYVLFQMMSAGGRTQLVEKSSSSAGLNTLSISKISDVTLPIPPRAEQLEIVRRVEEFFALVDQIEGRYSRAKTYVAKLTPLLLAKAFRGELVPQDPSEEPAESQLQKIRSDKEF
jgi:type I restriction enzyme S subunit